MYEQLRDRITTELFGILEQDDINRVLRAFDKIANDYEIKTKSTELVIYDYQHIPQMLKDYIACRVMENVSSETVKNYACVLRRFFIQVSKAPADITTNDIRLFLFNYQQQRNCTPRTIDKYRMYLCTFFSWAAENKYIPEDPTKRLPKIKYETPQRKAMTQTELEYIRRACKSLRDSAMVEFLYSTGCRVSELSGVKKEDIDWATNSVHLFGKGRKHRTSYLNAKAQVTLKAYLESRSDNLEWLFVKEHGSGPLKKEAIELAVKKIVTAAGLPSGTKITPHVFRHTTATTALANGMRIEEISKLLGHSSVNTTMIYAQTEQSAVQNAHIHSVV